MHVDQSRRDHQAGRVDHFGIVGARRRRARSPAIAAILQQERRHLVQFLRRIDDAPAAEEDRPHPSPPAVSPVGGTAGQQIEHRHPHRHAVGHLRQDDRVRSVGDVRVDLDAAIHRSRMQDHDLLRRAGEALVGDTEDAIVFAQRRNEAGRHPLELQPEHIERVGPLDRVLDATKDGHAEVRHMTRQQRRRAADRHLGAELGQAPDVAPRHARVEHVAHDADLEAGDPCRTCRAA